MHKNFNVRMHSDVYKWIWFKLGLMIDAIVVGFFDGEVGMAYIFFTFVTCILL